MELGLTKHEKISKNSKTFKALCVPGYIVYILVCVYGVDNFWSGFWKKYEMGKLLFTAWK